MNQFNIIPEQTTKGPQHITPQLVIGRIIKRPQSTALYDIENRIICRYDQVMFPQRMANDTDLSYHEPKHWIIDAKGNIEQTGDNLLIGFVNNLQSKPVILGSIPYNSDTRIEFNQTDQADAGRRILYRKETEGCLIEFNDDGQGEFTLDVTANADNDPQGTGNISISLTGADESQGNINVNLSGNITLTVGNNANITINGPECNISIPDGDTAVDIGGDVTATIGGNLTATVNRDAKIKAAGKAKVESAGNLDLRSDAKITINAGAGADMISSGPIKIAGTPVKVNALTL